MSGAAQLGASLSSLGSAQNAQVEAMLKIKGKAKSAAGEFESMFLNSMFEQMNTKVDGDGPFGGSGALESVALVPDQSICPDVRQEPAASASPSTSMTNCSSCKA